MIWSMTGYGTASMALSCGEYNIELRSVNSKGLDLRLTYPDELSAAEHSIRAWLRSRIPRGKIDVKIRAMATSQLQSIHLNETKLHHIQSIARQIAMTLDEGVSDHLQRTAPLSVDAALRFPGVIDHGALSYNPEKDENILRHGVEEACSQLVEMRQSEGRALEGILSTHLCLIRERVEQIELLAETIQATIQKKLSHKMAMSLQDALDFTVGTEPTQSIMSELLQHPRFLMEVAIISERSDIAEELSRLQAHVQQMQSLLSCSDPQGVGRRCDFLCQELLREANTCGSKVGEIKITHHVVELKSEIERFREQVQNVM